MSSDNRYKMKALWIVGLILLWAVFMNGFPASAGVVSPDSAADVQTKPAETVIDLQGAIDATRIKDIRIHGAYPVFTRHVTDVMRIRVGDVWHPEKLAEQKPLIETLFKSSGFRQPEIALTAEADPRDGHMIVTVQIQPGPYTRIDQVELNGVGAGSASLLKTRLVTWQRTKGFGTARRLIDSEIQKDIRALTEYFRKEKFLDVAVTHQIVTLSETDRVRLVYQVEKGPLYRLEWFGNHALSASVSQDIPFLKSTRPGPAAISQSIRQMVKRYRQAGYHAAKIQMDSHEVSDSADPEKRIRIQIDEGPFTQVAAIEFTGNDHIDSSELSGAMLTRLPGLLNKGALDLDRLDEDMLAIQSLYLTRGFLKASVSHVIHYSDDKTRATVRVTVQEGVQTHVRSIRIRGLSVISTAAAQSALKLQPGEPFRPYMVESDRNTLAEKVSETGRPHVAVTDTVQYDPDERYVDILYQVNEGVAVQTGQVVFVGNFRTRQSVLHGEMTLKPGDPFSLKQLLADQARLRNMDIFDAIQVQTPGLSTHAPVVDILVLVEEKKPYQIEAGTGFETAKGIFFHTRAGDVNFMGADMAAWLEGEISEIGYAFSSTLTDPRFLNSRFSASAGFYAEEISEFNQAFGTRSLGTSLSFNRKWRPTIETGLIFLLENRSVFSTEDDGATSFVDEFGNTLMVSDRSFMSVTPFIQYDSRDSLIRPKKGGYANLSVEPVKGLNSDLDDFIRFKSDLRGLISPLPRLTLAAMIKGAHLSPMNDSDRVSTDQLLYLGGSTTVRGFDENLLRQDELGNPVGAQSSLCGSLESRIDLIGNLELTLFVDAGRLSHYQTDGISDDFRFSTGIGLRYITPIGPMGIVYGHKLNREPNEDAGRFHIAIGYTF